MSGQCQEHKRGRESKTRKGGREGERKKKMREIEWRVWWGGEREKKG